MPGVLAGHQIATKRTTNRGTGQGMGETNALFGKAIDYRSLDEGVAHVGEFVVGQLVGHEIDDVGLFVTGLG